jgi:hypothetical protein
LKIQEINVFASQGAPPVSTDPRGNLPPVSRHLWQIMGAISDCLHLEVNLKKKIYLQYMLIVLHKGVKKFLTLLIEDVFTIASGINDTS